MPRVYIKNYVLTKYEKESSKLRMSGGSWTINVEKFPLAKYHTIRYITRQYVYDIDTEEALSNGFYKNYQELTAPYLVEDKFYDNDGYIVDAFKYENIEFSGTKKNLIIMGDSFARDFINMGRSNDYFKNYEFTIRPYNCFNKQNYTNEEKFNLIKEGDLIIISYRILPSEASKKCLKNKISYLEKNKIDFLVIGTKDFGYNINRPLKDKIYDFKGKPSEEILEFNDFLKNNVPNEKFIDLLSLISTEDGVPLFTDDNKLMSIDRAHLTYFGAQEVGKIIFSDIRLNDLN